MTDAEFLREYVDLELRDPASIYKAGNLSRLILSFTTPDARRDRAAEIKVLLDAM